MVGLSLAAVSIICGFFAQWIFRRTTDVARLRSTIKRMQAHLLEFRLFYDEPLLVWRAQKAIVRENGRFFLLIVRPLIIVTLPMAWLLVELDGVYAYGPLPVGQASVFTVQLAGDIVPEEAVPTLEAPPEIAIETPPVRSMADRQISWRLRPVRPVLGILRLRFPQTVIDTTIAAGERPIFFVRKFQPRTPSSRIDWIEIDYPKTDVSIVGIALPWIAWFVLLSTLSALVCARWLRFVR